MATLPKNKGPNPEFNIEDFARKHWNDGLRFARSKLGHRTGAKDITNFALYVIWDKAKVEKIRDPKAYFIQTIKNLCLKDIAQPGRVGEAAPEYEFENLKAPEKVKENELFSKSLFKAVLRNAIEKLPPAEQVVARLFYLEGKTPNEIDEELKIKPFTRRKRFSRGNKKLQQAALFYRAKKIFGKKDETLTQVLIRWVIKKESLKSIAPALGLTYLELGKIIRNINFKAGANELKKFRDWIDEFDPRKKDDGTA